MVPFFFSLNCLLIFQILEKYLHLYEVKSKNFTIRTYVIR